MLKVKLKNGYRRKRRNEKIDFIEDPNEKNNNINLADLVDYSSLKVSNNKNDDYATTDVNKSLLSRVLSDKNDENDNDVDDNQDDNDENKENDTDSDDSIKFHNFRNKPQETKFTQQKLPAWKPMLTPKFVINLFLICSILFVPIGILLYFTSNNIYEFRYDYTDCKDINNINRTCHHQLSQNINSKCKCRIFFTEDRFQDETLLVYYMLDNFYQNARRFVRSVDNNQLLGRKANIQPDLSETCEPYRNLVIDKVKHGFAPCGAIANSLFNDTFNIYYIIKHTNESIKLNISKEGIAWYSDKHFKYKNPVNLDFNNTIKPPNWAFNITQLKNSYENEDLIVWMRTAAFPSFRKLYGRILLEENARLAHKSNKSYLQKIFEKKKINFPNATYIEIKIKNESTILRLPKGNYYVDIDYHYPVKQFGGRKFFILANVSWLGGKCYFLAISFIVVGCICFLGSIVLFFLHVYYGNMHYNTAILLVDNKTSLVK